jgi:diguanylate cyclase (GGDEF)-like protein
MSLDPRTLLFALILTNALMALSLFVASSRTRRDGTLLWAMGMVLETLTWMLIAARGAIPDVLSLVVANGFLAGAHALALAAIGEFQHRPVPRWQYFVPVALVMVMAALLADDIRARFVWGGLIFGFQMVLIARMLLTDPETRAGRAWRLLLAGLVTVMLVLVLRAAVALSGYGEFAEPQSAIAPHPVQILSFVVIMAAALIGSVAFILMVKERTDREILELAMTDSLTGIPNRRALMELAEHAMARRGAAPMTLMMIDVDHFKRINDTWGHPTGDAVLRQVARLLAGRLRGGDVLGRYGGEEFCVLAPDTDHDGARTLAESLREIISYKTLSIENESIQVTVSVGVACCRADSLRDLKDLLAEADAALYAAKEAGRNRVVSFTC